MLRPLNRSWLAVVVLLLGLLIAGASCDSDDREPGAPAGTGDGTPVADFTEPTPGGEADEDEDVESNATVPPASADDGTPSTSGLPAPDAEGTPATVAERTVTPDSDAVGPQGEGMFPEVGQVTTALENFTLTIAGTHDIGTANTDATGIDLLYQQSAPEVFYILVDGDDQFDVEAWQMDDQLLFRDGEEISEAPPEVAEEFDIGSYLSTLPEVERIPDAEEVGNEDVAGLETTHYSVPADEALQYMPGMDDADVGDTEGSIEIWYAEEDDIVARIVVDLTWTNADDSDGSTNLEYVLADISSTADVQPPQE